MQKRGFSKVEFDQSVRFGQVVVRPVTMVVEEVHIRCYCPSTRWRCHLLHPRTCHPIAKQCLTDQTTGEYWRYPSSKRSRSRYSRCSPERATVVGPPVVEVAALPTVGTVTGFCGTPICHTAVQLVMSTDVSSASMAT